MKEYKLIKKYPGSPMLGTVLVMKRNGWYESENSNQYPHSPEVIENNPEFWEEVIEYPVGTKIKDVYSLTEYIKKENGWLYIPVFTNTTHEINESEIGDGKRFRVIEEPTTKEKIMQECIRRFPKGSKVKCALSGNIYTIAQNFTTPREGDWIEGVYYYGADDNILAIIEGKSQGFYLYHKGKYAELVEEPKKDYEILSFLNTANKCIFYKIKDDKYSSFKEAKIGTFKEDEVLCMSHFTIHSVKRLSDEEVFTIGDKTNHGTIKEFKVCRDNRILLSFLEHFCLPCYLDAKGSLPKKLKSLFTTEDGVDIREGDDYYVVWFKEAPEGVSLFNVSKKFKAKVLSSNEIWSSDAKKFSTKEKAEEYILLNKPCLSINDIENISTWDNLIEDLKQLVKSRL